ncbi:S8 family serine peptidase [Pseudomonas asiatica]|uniref:S8 family peptidase n=1 Tax=Pseudomonas asiatica TaxID=2219225 RepID=UPI0025AB26CC|nr:S8 family serine peptidase [Pseudomonas asiatica]MDM9554780.1 S8 family serine peptidase [Pseudomonas asiatica]
MEKYIILRKTMPKIKKMSGLVSDSSTGITTLAFERIPKHALFDLQRDPEVKVITPAMSTTLIHPLRNDIQQDYEGNSWGIDSIEANNSPYTGEGVTMAILDTGIDKLHPAFSGINLLERDFTGEGNGDCNGHGTHCAGTAFGRDIDGRRIGVARGVNQALIGKVVGTEGGDTQMLFEGLQWALAEKANIISMSIGFNFSGEIERKITDGWPLDLATSQALDSYRGNLRILDSLMQLFKTNSIFNMTPLIIAATGNDSRRSLNSEYKISATLPAAAEGIISVAAASSSGENYDIADFSNSLPTLTAPGVNITSAWPGGALNSLSGTSMACPHVAGVAALWWQRLKMQGAPNLSKAVASNLISHAQIDLFLPGLDSSDFGHGMVTAPK